MSAPTPDVDHASPLYKSAHRADVSIERFTGHDYDVHSALVMMVDDEPVNIKVLQKYLKADGYTRFESTSDSTEVIERMRATPPDVLLLDVMMPHVDGLTILREMRRDPRLQFIPVIIVTASNDNDTKLRALELGATDFLAKPVDPNDLVPRVRNALKVKAYQDRLEEHSVRLEELVRQRTTKLESSRLHVIHCLARAAEYRDDDTGNHVIRVGLYAGVIARHLGLAASGIRLLEHAGQLHDVGKIGVADAILHKPGKLTEEEFDTMKSHCDMGREIILGSAIDFGDGPGAHLGSDAVDVLESPVLTMAAVIAQTHHEKWDGSGYPRGLDGTKIPIEGRIAAVADVYDALRSKRPYKRAFRRERCLEIIREGRGTHFDPRIADAFLRHYDEIIEVENRYKDRDPADGGLF